MSPPTRPGPSDRAARAIAHVGLPNLVARLYRYARVTLHLAASDADRADVFEASDLVNALVLKVLDGTLIWTLREDATDDQIVRYACKKLYGMRSTHRRKAALFDDGDAIDELACEAPDALELLVERRGIADAVRAFEHDAEASVYLAEMLAGRSHPEIADALGYTPKHAEAVHKRVTRGIATLRARMDTQSEDEPPSSGPRGTYHEPQATEERQGAPPEPHRGAGGARRRR
jgi:DNA-directed RNA polymerase specialized sigma24 family protein